MDTSSLTFAEELSAFEYMMFRADADAHSRTSLMFIEVLDVVPDLDRLRQDVDRSARLVPRLRQRVVAPMIPLAPARWVYDPDFSLDYHLRHIALPGPGTFRQLLDLAEVLHSTPLDLGRPLWEATLVEGLQEGGPAALLWKMSHAVTDGVGGVLLDQMLHLPERNPDRGPMPPVPVPEDLSSVDLTRRAIRGLPMSMTRSVLGRTTGAVRATGRAARNPVGTVAAGVRTLNELRSMSDDSSPSPLLCGRGLHRRFDVLEYGLADLRAAAKSEGCSVNDAYLAALAGGMRNYHEALGVPVDEISLAMPVNIRDAASKNASNQWSAVTVRLPVGVTDPGVRMKTVRANVLTARDGTTIDAAALVAPLTAWLPQQIVAGAQGRALPFDLQASNVPGHPTDRFIAGARIAGTYAIGPLPGVAMMATMVSFAGRCSVGLNYDTAAFTRPELLMDSLRAGFDEVLALAPDDADRAPAASADPTPKKAAAKKRAAKKAPAKQAPAKKAPAGTPETGAGA